MEFEDRIAELATKVRDRRSAIQTEEAAKNALIMPFIQILGYDVFDPKEVVPEYTADFGTKKGEKIDYAIVRNGEVQILIECKQPRDSLKVVHASQLYRYFSVTRARIAILTNGQVYHFYSDLDAPNLMDEKPFLVLDLEDIDEALLPELRKLSKEHFDLDSVIYAAEELRQLSQIKRTLAAQFKEPDDDWVRYFAARLHEGSFTQKVRQQFRPLVAKAAAQFIRDQVNDRLKSALYANNNQPDVSTAAEAPDNETAEVVDAGRDTEVETTLEELTGYQIVKAIACSEVKPQRIVGRDAKSYFAILLDDNNRRPIARLHFNGKARKYLGTFDENKVETRHLIDSLDDIYLYADAIRSAVRNIAS
ncbi:type I restriction endonuclease [Catellatospora tritici]|uniref:type I restriction endonuclease n=1 Tax=Catellatospora tritici TaxID=2851566 RepID=UPI001C2D1F8B|nr:type I restriction endonuclease [Catellatospora tritici]MBV1849542.1 type I restriction enzyme HsdR N-terminal domain-containing protein [Catellatospora tritici]MBV1854114.1 type I restriction enzyme HsdR N-terminal domain-containing protein [Catellatospora tritici]